MTTPFLADAYVRLLIEPPAHRRGIIHAMGGMAAQIPIKNDFEANALALDKVRQDKLREVKAGHDGTWVAHPGLIPVARAIFDEHMTTPNQIARKLEPAVVGAEDLLARPMGTITAAGLRWNINDGVALSRSMAAWFRLRAHLQPDGRRGDCGNFSRASLAMGEAYAAVLDNGEVVTCRYVPGRFVAEEVRARFRRAFQGRAFAGTNRLWQEEFPDFLTLAAYEELD